MNYGLAVAVLERQAKNLRKADGVRFVHDGYEYRLSYRGGFAPYVGIDRRRIGKRNFQYFGGVGADRCRTVDDVMKLVMAEIGK